MPMGPCEKNRFLLFVLYSYSCPWFAGSTQVRAFELGVQLIHIIQDILDITIGVCDIHNIIHIIQDIPSIPIGVRRIHYYPHYPEYPATLIAVHRIHNYPHYPGYPVHPNSCVHSIHDIPTIPCC